MNWNEQDKRWILILHYVYAFQNQDLNQDLLYHYVLILLAHF